MEITLMNVILGVIAIVTTVCSFAAVFSGHILRAVTALLFVLFGTAGIYFMLGYTFLGTVQITVYAGGIVVLYVFSILLTRSDKSINEKIPRGRLLAAIITTLTGAVLTVFIISTHKFSTYIMQDNGGELSPVKIGEQLLSVEKYGYVLPFEVISMLLLACMIGGLVIARKR